MHPTSPRTHVHRAAGYATLACAQANDTQNGSRSALPRHRAPSFLPPSLALLVRSVHYSSVHKHSRHALQVGPNIRSSIPTPASKPAASSTGRVTGPGTGSCVHRNRVPRKWDVLGPTVATTAVVTAASADSRCGVTGEKQSRWTRIVQVDNAKRLEKMRTLLGE